MKTIAVIDIGSNSIRLVLVELGPEGTYKIVNDLKESVRMEDGLWQTNEIQPAQFKNAMQTLRMFKSLCDAVKVDEIIAVATEAIRRAKNGQEFVDTVKAEFGLSISVLTGQEEAFYDYLGVVNSLDITDGLIVDIGGGSTELILMKNRQLIESISLPFGNINISQRFKLGDIVQTSQENALKKFLLKIFQDIPWLAKLKKNPPVMIGVGGSLRNVGKIIRKRVSYPIDLAHNYQMSGLDMQQIYQVIKDMPLSERHQIEGLSRDRADIIVGPLIIVQVLMEYCGIQQVIISGNGIREGLVFAHLGMDHELVDVLDYSLHNNCINYGLNEAHARNVYRLSQELFNQLAKVHKIKTDMDKIIKTAAVMHDCGISLRFYGHDKHTFYIMTNSEINGLTHRELLMAAYLAACSSKDKVKIDLLRYRGLIDKDDAAAINKTAVLLRIARSLDRSMTGVIQDIKCQLYKDNVIIKATAQYNPELEVKDAMRWATRFKKEFKRDLYIG
ncbi:MAG: exopolyphosphatase [Acidobacteriota bacterium]